MRRKNSIVYVLMRPYQGRVLALCVMTVVSALLQVGFALVTSKVVDAALGHPEKLLFWSCVLVADLIGIVVFHALQNWLVGSTMDRSAAGLRYMLLQTATYSEGEKLHQFHSGALLNRGMEDVRTVCDGVVNALPSMVGQITRLAGSFAAVVVLYRPIAGMIALAALVVAGMIAWLRPILKRQHSRMRKTEEKVSAAMQEDLQQLELIQSLGAQGQILRRFQSRLDDSLDTKKTRRAWLVGYSSVMTAVTQMGTGVLLLWGATQVAAEALSYGALTAMVQLMSLLRGPVVGLSGVWTRLTSVEVAAERLAEMLGDEKPVQPVDVKSVKQIVFEDVTFAYPGEEAPVLEHFSTRFSLDNWVCLTGVSGKGKSTLFKLVLGLYTPQQGRVYVVTEQGEIPCGKETRSLFAYVPQDYALFSGTVLDNLLLVNPQASAQTRKQALETAQAQYIWEMSEGEETPVLENNAGLSKGQLQRLAVARAILTDRPVFLLDECTSALDAQTEEALLQALHGLGKQAILVTHRPEALSKLSNVQRVTLEK